MNRLLLLALGDGLVTLEKVHVLTYRGKPSGL
jgi:hypothetical protein